MLFPEKYTVEQYSVIRAFSLRKLSGNFPCCVFGLVKSHDLYRCCVEMMVPNSVIKIHFHLIISCFHTVLFQIMDAYCDVLSSQPSFKCKALSFGFMISPNSQISSSTTCRGIEYFQPFDCAIMNFDHAIIPLGRDCHWTALIIDLRNERLIHYDSCFATKSVHGDLVSLFQVWLNAEFIGSNFSVVNVSSPSQKDSVSCGIYALYFIENYLRKSSLKFTASSKDISQMRMNVSLSLFFHDMEQITDSSATNVLCQSSEKLLQCLISHPLKREYCEIFNLNLPQITSEEKLSLTVSLGKHAIERNHIPLYYQNIATVLETKFRNHYVSTFLSLSQPNNTPEGVK